MQFKSRRRFVIPAIDLLEGRKLLSVADPTFTYYPDGHVASEVSQDNQGHQFAESFNEAGQVTKVHAITVSDGSLYQDATYGYDTNGTLRNREIVGADGTDSTWTFRANGTTSAAMVVRADGTQRIDTYNAIGQATGSLTTDGNGDFVSLERETYYADGDLKSYAISKADGSGVAYGFDDSGPAPAQVISYAETSTDGTTHVFVRQDGGWWV